MLYSGGVFCHSKAQTYHRQITVFSQCCKCTKELISAVRHLSEEYLEFDKDKVIVFVNFLKNYVTV